MGAQAEERSRAGPRRLP